MAYIVKEELLAEAKAKQGGVFAAPVIVRLIQKAPEVEVYKLGEWKIDTVSNSSMKEQVQLVKQLGDKMGYGHLMALASAVWRKKLCDEHGEQYKSGAFIPVVDCVVEPEHLRKMKKELELYDNIVKRALEVNDNG